MTNTRGRAKKIEKFLREPDILTSLLPDKNKAARDQQPFKIREKNLTNHGYKMMLSGCYELTENVIKSFMLARLLVPEVRVYQQEKTNRFQINDLPADKVS